MKERIAKNIFFSPNFFTRAFNKNLKTTHSYIRAINFIEMYKKKLLSENISNEYLKVLILKKKIELKVLILKKKKSKNIENSKLYKMFLQIKHLLVLFVLSLHYSKESNLKLCIFSPYHIKRWKEAMEGCSSISKS